MLILERWKKDLTILKSGEYWNWLTRESKYKQYYVYISFDRDYKNGCVKLYRKAIDITVVGYNSHRFRLA